MCFDKASRVLWSRRRFSPSPIRDELVDVLAASNWHALASYVAAEIQKATLLIDIGSTTTDIIPLTELQSQQTKTDFDRLRQGQLVYIGCKRTPVCSLVTSLVFNGFATNVMNELFATIDDVLLVLGQAEPDDQDNDSADGRPRTVACATNRLARMIGLDHRHVTQQQATELAQQVIESARDRIRVAIEKNHDGQIVVLSGHGEVLLQFPDETKIVRLTEKLGPELSRCAPAYGVAWLLHQSVEA